MKVYKYTSHEMTSYAGHKWKLNEKCEIKPWYHSPTAALCTPHWFHCYRHPFQAFVYRKAHTSFWDDGFFFEAEGNGHSRHRYDKSGVTELTLTKQIKKPFYSDRFMNVFFALGASKGLIAFKTHWSCDDVVVATDYLKAVKQKKKGTPLVWAGYNLESYARDIFKNMDFDSIIKLHDEAVAFLKEVNGGANGRKNKVRNT
jgi:hypothetical protein